MVSLPSDYHTHTTYSCDAFDTIDAMCRHALAIGLREVAFTDHLDLHPMDSCTAFYRPADFLADLEVCRAAFPMLVLRAGVEIGEPHRYADRVAAMIDGRRYDVRIGSLHWVGDEMVFEDGYFARRSKDRAALDYFEEMLCMVRHGGFEILGHLDVFRRYGVMYYDDLDLAPYEEAIRAILQTCIAGGIAVEINTAGLRYPSKRLHPDLEVLRWYREMGGERLTVGSDAHRAEGMALGFDLAREMALAAGFTRLCRFENRQVCGWAAIT
ncbi:MAG: histidinol-phosphatase HisJ family protein [Anaerolineae bacterium]|nr:histidinol-phosphatase HisJ family protein [Anaerolineae bacterium]